LDSGIESFDAALASLLALALYVTATEHANTECARLLLQQTDICAASRGLSATAELLDSACKNDASSDTSTLPPRLQCILNSIENGTII